jgi:sugar phosphate isomerase/epimerase
MRIGCCIEPGATDNLRIAAAAGFDYVELPLSSIAELGWPKIEELRSTLTGLGLAAECFNVFLPGDIKVVGPDVSWGEFCRYVSQTFQKASALGGQYVVFGSGRSRAIPQSFPAIRAYQQFLTALDLAAELAEPLGLTVLVETLRREECNFVNLVSEGAAIARFLNRPGVGALADYFHMAGENEPLTDLSSAADILRHAHYADPDGRVFPSAEKPSAYQPFFEALKSSGYNSRVSIEASMDNFAENAPKALEALKPYRN